MCMLLVGVSVSILYLMIYLPLHELLLSVNAHTVMSLYQKSALILDDSRLIDNVNHGIYKGDTVLGCLNSPYIRFLSFSG